MTGRCTWRAGGAALLLAASLCAGIIDRIAVTVGNRVITASGLDREIRVNAFLNGAPPDFSAANKRATAGRMVEQQLVRRELENSRYPTPAPSEVDPAVESFKQEHYPSGAEFARALKEYGITEQDARDELLWQRTLLLFIEVRFRPGVQVSNQEIEEYFEKTVKPAAEAAHPGQPVGLEDYRERIERTLTGQRVDREVDAWLAAARRRTEIVYHDEVFR